MTWLLTGGCGFVGSNLADALLTMGVEITVLDNLSRIGSRDNLRWLQSKHGSDWRFVENDTRDPSSVASLALETRPKVIAHLAGQVAMTTSIQNPRLDFEVNALGTLNVLEAVRLHSPQSAIIYSSTNKVYGSLDYLRYEETDTRYTLPDYPNGLDETLHIEGSTPYGCSKMIAEQYVRDYHRIYGLDTVVLRHSSMYGGRQFATYDQGWIGWFCQKAIEMGEKDALPFKISGDGKQVRDVLHSADLVQAYIKVSEHLHHTSGQIYNIGGGMGNSLSLLELFEKLRKLTGNEMRFDRLQWRQADQKVFVADYRKAFQDFGWSPIVSTEEGLVNMVQWTQAVLSEKRGR